MMNTWVFRTLIGLLAVQVLFGLWAAITHQPPPRECVGGIVMVLDQGRNMMVQVGTWPTHCVAISKD